MVLDLMLQYAMFYDAKCAFLFFLDLVVWGMYNWLLFIRYHALFLFNDLLIYLEILFFVLLLSFSMFYVIAFLFDILQLLVP